MELTLAATNGALHVSRSDARDLRVLALVPYPLGEAPGQRYRIEQWAPYLDEEGVRIHFEPFADASLREVLYRSGRYFAKTAGMLRACLRRTRVARRAGAFDAVFLHREAALIGPAWTERMVRTRNARLVYDFDDAVWLRYVSPSNRYLSYLKTPGKTADICRMAAAITVGSETLAEYAASHGTNVSVLPSTVSLRDYRQRPSAAAPAVPVIGWTGSHSSAQYLRIVEGPLRELAKTRRFRFLVIGVSGYRVDGVDVECRAWKSETEVEDLWPIDVGIMPLFDDPWARGKCAMKAIQYLGVGIPAVVSPVGANREVVTEGVCGFHAASERDWVSRLGELLDHHELRSRLGAEGRRRVEAQYSAEVQAPRLAAILRGLA
jgi:glycosyltransferase involved in cell wall biosynthesis